MQFVQGILMSQMLGLKYRITWNLRRRLIKTKSNFEKRDF